VTTIAPPAQPPIDLLRRAKRIGYVFSGGSSRCAFQVGVIEELRRVGIQPALTIGVSAGAWNAAIVSARIESRIRYYWRSFMRMPHVDLRKVLVDHTPYRFRELHARTFERFIGQRLHAADALPLFVGVTRLRDGRPAIIDARQVEDPLTLLLASNYLPPFYTHAPEIQGERYGDGGMSDNAPYEKAFDEGCDAVVLVALKGESEGDLSRSPRDGDHRIPEPYASRTIVIRPRHRVPVSFTERRWAVLEQLIHLGELRTREVLFGERHEATELRASGPAPSARVMNFIRTTRSLFRH